MIFLLKLEYAQAELFVYSDQATGLLGFKDSQGNVTIPAQFSHVMVPEGKKLFSPEDKETQVLVPVAKDGNIWRMTSDGALKFATVFFDNGPDYYAEGLSRFIEKGKGMVVINPIYDFATPFRKGLAYVCKGCHAEYTRMPTYQPLSASFYQHPREEMDTSIVGGKWGAINKKGTLLAPLIYDSLTEVAEKQQS